MANALVVIDVQNYFINDYTKKIPSKIANFIAEANSKKLFDYILFIKFVNHPNSNFVKSLNWSKMMSSPDTDIVRELKEYILEDNIFIKSTFSAFKSEPFLDFIRNNSIHEFYLCGLDIDGCIYATALDGFDQGSSIKILQDLCISHSGKELTASGKLILKKNIGKLVINSTDI